MIDIKLLREKPEVFQKGAKDKGIDIDINHVLEIDIKYRELQASVQKLREERNKVAKEKNIEEGKRIKNELEIKENALKAVEEELREWLLRIPNPPDADAPKGKDEKDNIEVRKWGEIKKFNFEPKDHLELGKNLDIIDFERGAKVAGSGFYYLKNEGALLEIALVHYGLEFLNKKCFTPIITPDLARERFYLGTGYMPKGPEAQTYTICDSDLGLIATSEVTLAGYHADEVLMEKDLPKKYGGYSHCFRVEGGAYGKYSKGLYRVHQFTKVEIFVYSKPEESKKIHEDILSLEEEFWQSLGVSYRVVEMCTADLGAQAVRKYDLEAWMPGRKDFGEITSTSNTTDFQARRLNIKYRKDNESHFVHTLNGTLVATSRGPIAILENYQEEDGSVIVPEILRKYTGFDKISKK